MAPLTFRTKGPLLSISVPVALTSAFQASFHCAIWDDQTRKWEVFDTPYVRERLETFIQHHTKIKRNSPKRARIDWSLDDELDFLDQTNPPAAKLLRTRVSHTQLRYC